MVAKYQKFPLFYTSWRSLYTRLFIDLEMQFQIPADGTSTYVHCIQSQLTVREFVGVQPFWSHVPLSVFIWLKKAPHTVI